jgi:hypothetical protein
MIWLFDDFMIEGRWDEPAGFERQNEAICPKDYRPCGKNAQDNLRASYRKPANQERDIAA